MGSKYKLIALDMDGTLLTSDKKIRTDTQEILKKAAASGKYVSLSTGRGLQNFQTIRRSFLMSNMAF